MRLTPNWKKKTKQIKKELDEKANDAAIQEKVANCQGELTTYSRLGRLTFEQQLEELGDKYREAETTDIEPNAIHSYLWPINNHLSDADLKLGTLLGVAKNLGKAAGTAAKVKGFIHPEAYQEATAGTAKKNVITILSRYVTGRTSPDGKSNHVHINGNAEHNVLFRAGAEGAITILGFVMYHMDSSMTEGQRAEVAKIEARTSGFQEVVVDTGTREII
jgi:hypothetical protein